MIGGGGSTANRAAADVMGTEGASGRGAAMLADEVSCLGATGTAVGTDDDTLGRAGMVGAGVDVMGRGGMGRSLWIAGVDEVGATPSPRKSLTRVSTSWLIEMLLASQNALSRS